MSDVHGLLTSVGNTPMVRPAWLDADLPGDLYLKLERRNPLGSVKDRIGLSMVLAAERDGSLVPGGTIVEATSGNTGIALAYIGALRGYRVVITMPEGLSAERATLLAALGARVEQTNGSLGMNGAVARAEEIVATDASAVLMRQFSNPANPRAHQQGTGPELVAALGAVPDVFVAGVGTGGTITGVARHFKQDLGVQAHIVAVEPAESPVLGGGAPGSHGIQGIGAGFIPPVLERELVDQILPVTTANAMHTARDLALREGILAGPSAGANVWAALQIAARPEMQGKSIVTVICDTGERYLSTTLFQQEGI